MLIFEEIQFFSRVISFLAISMSSRLQFPQFIAWRNYYITPKRVFHTALAGGFQRSLRESKFPSAIKILSEDSSQFQQ